MSHKEQKDFCLRVKKEFPHFFKNKKVLDIGLLDINSSNKDLFENCEYIYLDVNEGKNVDIINTGHLYDAPDETFDVIISTEVFEYDVFYEKTIQNITRMLKNGGLFIFTCVFSGRKEHENRYYKNLQAKDVKSIDGFRENYSDGYFEFNDSFCEVPADLYFYGIKGGKDKLKCYDIPEVKYNQFNDDIFVVDCWTDTQSKKENLVNLIKRIKVFGIPILLSTHYPVEKEIQNMVDYYIFDKDNPILTKEEFDDYSVYSNNWIKLNNLKFDSVVPFHHDYAVWKTFKNTFNFCQFLGKKNIHFLEYDNLPDEFQYKQCFLERINNHDAIIYNHEINENYEACSTFIFSIKTDVAVKTVNSINNKEEYFLNKPKGWQLERVFLNQLRNFTSNIFISNYVDNDLSLNTQAVWNRDGIIKEKEFITIYNGCDIDDNIYLILTSGFNNIKSSKDNLIEINYGKVKTFYNLKKDDYVFINLGKYQRGNTVRCYLNGVNIFENFLIHDAETFRKNHLVSNEIPKNKININWVNGPRVDIVGDNEISYNVKFIDNDTSNCLYESNLSNNCWAQSSIKYYVNWRIEVRYNDNVEIFNLDLQNKNVLVDFQSGALGDSLAWIEAVNQFQIKHNCNVTCKIFIKDLFENQYPNIKFIYPGDIYENIHVIYELGIFYNENNQICKFRHKENPLQLSLNKIADQILDVNTDLLVPKLKLPTKTHSDKKYVCIATQSTCQSKYWNNKEGWNKTVDYLKSLGYEVICIDKEKIFGVENFFNTMPENCTDKTGNHPIRNRIEDIVNCEFFIGLSSGLSWLAWACKKPVIMISGFTDSFNEFYTPYRVINKSVCNSCWNDTNYRFNSRDWLWCPRKNNFECTKEITFDMVKQKIDDCIRDLTS